MHAKSTCPPAPASSSDSLRSHRHQTPRIAIPAKSLIGFAVWALSLTLFAQPSAHEFTYGVAWRVIGQWQSNRDGKLISNGDALLPGSLLRPGGSGHDHSITVLLPDGQRILYECFASRDCARGFRVPLLYRKPLPLAVDLITRVNAVERRKSAQSKHEQEQSDSSASRDEAMALIGSDHKVVLAGLPAALSNGTYSYVVRSLSHLLVTQSRREFEKQGKFVTLTLPSAGLFDVLITDHLNTPRIDLLLAAVRQPVRARTIESFHSVEALLKDWNEDYQGWPVHEFKRDYLRSIVLHIAPSLSAHRSVAKIPAGTEDSSVVCEPEFNPMPGVFKTDTEVRLHCNTPEATIHYTVDGSQPLERSAVYRAPIMVKGTALTIKAFATAQGKKDSPVVTGIFRIGD